MGGTSSFKTNAGNLILAEKVKLRVYEAFKYH